MTDPNHYTKLPSLNSSNIIMLWWQVVHRFRTIFKTTGKLKTGNRPKRVTGTDEAATVDNKARAPLRLYFYEFMMIIIYYRVIKCASSVGIHVRITVQVVRII